MLKPVNYRIKVSTLIYPPSFPNLECPFNLFFTSCPFHFIRPAILWRNDLPSYLITFTILKNAFLWHIIIHQWADIMHYMCAHIKTRVWVLTFKRLCPEQNNKLKYEVISRRDLVCMLSFTNIDVPVLNTNNTRTLQICAHISKC